MFLRRTVYFKSNKKIRRAEKYKRDARLFHLGLSRFFGGLEAVFGVGEAGKAERQKTGKAGKAKDRKAWIPLPSQGMTAVWGSFLARFVHCAALRSRL